MEFTWIFAFFGDVKGGETVSGGQSSLR